MLHLQSFLVTCQSNFQEMQIPTQAAKVLMHSVLPLVATLFSAIKLHQLHIIRLKSDPPAWVSNANYVATKPTSTPQKSTYSLAVSVLFLVLMHRRGRWCHISRLGTVRAAPDAVRVSSNRITGHKYGLSWLNCLCGERLRPDWMTGWLCPDQSCSLCYSLFCPHVEPESP